MAIQTNFPAIKPTLLLDFANTEQLDPRITFTRASTATYYGTQTAKAEENLVLQSQDFTTTWLQSNTTRSANTTVAPDGTTTADTITDTTDTGAHIINQSPVFIAGAVYTFSCFLKANTHNFALVTLTNPTTVNNGITAVVDLSTGAITQTATGTSATFTSSSITSVGNGWYRVVITGSSVASFNRAEIGFAPAATGNTFATNQRISYTGTGTASFFAWGAQLEQRSAATAYTPTTTAPITNYIPRLLTAASGVARFDHNPTTFESLGLEIEEQRTNLLLQSETFATTWSAVFSSITANTVVSPAGTLTADVLIADTNFSSHFISQNATTTATATTFSIYAKSAGVNFVALQISDSSNTGRVTYFNLSTGVVGTTGTGITASMVSVGNGWYRCVATVATALAGSNNCVVAVVNADSGSLAYTGDVYSGIYIWGAQLEAGAFATSYIPTVASQVTRAADAASMTGTNFSSWFNQAEGTFFSSVVLNQTPATLSGFGIYAASDNTQSNRVFVNMGSGSGGNINALVTTSGVTQSQTINASLSTAGAYQYANAYKVNDFASVANGGVAVTDTSGTVPVVDRLYLGASAIGTPNLNSTIRKIAYYPIRVSNTNLQALTS